MPDNISKEELKFDIDCLLDLTANFDFSDPDKAEKALPVFEKRNPLRTEVLRNAFAERLSAIAYGFPEDTCLLCRKRPANDKIICNYCRKQFSDTTEVDEDKPKKQFNILHLIKKPRLFSRIRLPKIESASKLIIPICALCIAFFGGVLVGVIAEKKLSAPQITHDIINWPGGILAQQIPQPGFGMEGELVSESNTYLHMSFFDHDKQDFEEYVEICKDWDFTWDSISYSNFYSAKNESGYQLTVSYYEDGNYIDITVNSPQQSQPTGAPATPDNAGDTETGEQSQQAPSPGVPDVPAQTGDIHATMDAYESFVDEYIAFMQEYSSATGFSQQMVDDYTTYLTRYLDVMTSINSMDTRNLSTSDLEYFVEVRDRINEKLSEATL